MKNYYDPFNILRGKKEYKGEPPGTIAYTGQYVDVEVKIECYEYNKDEITIKNVSEIDNEFNQDMTYWFNIIGLNNADLIKSIGEKFCMHHMDVEDIVHVSQWSKIEVKRDYIFSILKMIYLNEKKIIHEHLGILQKDNIVITFQETPGDVFDEIRERLKEGKGQIRDKGSDYLFYTLLDALIDQYFIIINHISTDFKQLEMKILENDIQHKEKIYEMRKELVYLFCFW
ncbi:CorA family divalent cation transporter [Fusibacter tunisiensis]|uniref:Mg2+ and Co2+ transporter CorA n=1 Tax=Fusibacter tunisiensis TaxID=1008308 RepID=A0ABS2MUB3_9FIRM|nr:CorA family divalent cation transporter [Fusibacter tunisiensis]MBM7562996.1 Mg2+ and Co2+ transporter CorA [Fusibacter tunisiensis]